MGKSAQSIFYFGIYLIGIGVTLLVVPNLLLAMFGLPETSEVWIRVVGMLAFILAGYYLTAAKHDFRPFFRVSVYLRASVVLFFGAFVVIGLAEPPLLLFAGMDLLCAAWTQWALNKEKEMASGT